MNTQLLKSVPANDDLFYIDKYQRPGMTHTLEYACASAETETAYTCQKWGWVGRVSVFVKWEANYCYIHSGSYQLYSSYQSVYLTHWHPPILGLLFKKWGTPPRLFLSEDVSHQCVNMIANGHEYKYAQKAACLPTHLPTSTLSLTHRHTHSYRHTHIIRCVIHIVMPSLR